MKKLIFIILILMAAKSYSQRDYVLIEVFTLPCHDISSYTPLLKHDNVLLVHWPLNSIESIHRKKRRLESNFTNSNSYISVEGFTQLNPDSLEQFPYVVDAWRKEPVTDFIKLEFKNNHLYVRYSANADLWIIGRESGRLEPSLVLNIQDNLAHIQKIPVGSMKEFIVFIQGMKGTTNIATYHLPKDTTIK